MAFFDRLKNGLKKTKQAIARGFDEVIYSFNKPSEELFEELEEMLITSDVGITVTEMIMERFREVVEERLVSDPKQMQLAMADVLCEIMGDDEPLNLSAKPSVLLIVGVNGGGKTTTSGKLASKLRAEGKSVIMAAADTFRAAASEQLKIWGDRAGVPVISQGEGADPAAVVFDAAQAVKSKNADVLICDTAGRLHNKKNLMDELAKINRVIRRELPGANVETLLVLDATTGQNALNQAKEFSKAAEVTGIVLTKLDGTAKGGAAIAVRKTLGIPVKVIGVGEKTEDMEIFCAADFAKALLNISD